MSHPPPPAWARHLSCSAAQSCRDLPLATKLQHSKCGNTIQHYININRMVHLFIKEYEWICKGFDPYTHADDSTNEIWQKAKAKKTFLIW